MDANNDKRIETAAKIMGKALAKLAKTDPEMAKRIREAVIVAVHG